MKNAMKLSPDSPELTAYALGELAPAERAAVEAALAESPELRAELAALRDTVGLLSAEFATEPAVELSPAQRAAIVRSAEGQVTDARSETSGSVAVQTELSRQSSAPTLWERFLVWRASLLWATAALSALVLSFAFWPRPHNVERQFARLRYQPEVRSEAVPTPLPAPNALLGTNAFVSRSLEEAAKGKADAAVALGVTATATPSAPLPSGKLEVGQRYDLRATASGPATGDKTSLNNRFGAQLGQDKPAAATDWAYSTTPRSLTEPLASSAGTSVSKDFFAAGNAPAQDANAASASFPTLAAGSAATAPQPSSETVALGTKTRGLSLDTLARSKTQESELVRSRFARFGEQGDRQETVAESEAKRVMLGRAVQQPVDEARLSESLVREKTVELQQLSDRLDSETRLYYRLPSGGVVGGLGGAEAYAAINDNPFKDVTAAPLSTFGMDVDTGSYANIRRFLRGGSLPPPDAVRLEELINYFHYDYPQPRGDEPFGATVEVAGCPWSETHKLVRVGIRAKDLARGERPRANLVFLLDVSGSMQPENRLPLAKRAMRLLLEKLTPRDTVGIVTYAGEAKIALEPIAITSAGKQRVTDVLEGLRAGSGTHGSAGIQNAYAMATNHFVKEGVNRVILCTDGDFNIGITDRGELLDLITQEAKSGVFLSVLGFGMDNLKDATMETLADKGNGNYAYIDSFSEARKVLVEQLDGTLVTVAKDAKVQVEFNPARVASYRLLGYEKRLLRDRDFNDDTKDAGEVGAGHSVTVLYEIIPAGPNLAGVDPLRYGEKQGDAETVGRAIVKPVHTDELLNLKLRYKQPDGDKSRLIEQPVKDADREFAQAGADLKFAAAVAGYGMLLRDSPHKGDLTWDKVLRLAEQGLGDDKEGYRAEFVDLARTAQKLSGGK